MVPEPDPESFRRIKNLRGLGDRQRSILQALCFVRDQVAQQMDAAPFRVAGNDLLLRLATETSNGQLSDRLLASVNRHVRGEFSERAQRAVDTALKGPPPPAMIRTISDHVRLTRHEIERRKVAERRFKAWRNVEAARRNVGLQAIVPTPVLDELIRKEDWELQELAVISRLGSRRVERYGEDLIRLARG
jgi:ribonuclease D